MRSPRAAGALLLVAAPPVLGGRATTQPDASATSRTPTVVAIANYTGAPPTSPTTPGPATTAPASPSSTPSPSSAPDPSAGPSLDGGPFDTAPTAPLPSSRYVSTPQIAPVQDTVELDAVEQHGSTFVLVVDRVAVRICSSPGGGLRTCPGEYAETNDSSRLRRYPLAAGAVLIVAGASGEPGDRIQVSPARLRQYVPGHPAQLVNLRFDSAGRVTGLAQPDSA